MIAEALCLVDSNILIRLVQPDDPEFATIQTSLAVLTRRAVTLCYTSQNLGEFWNSSTRPISRNGFGLSPEEADRRARSIEGRLHLLPDNPSVHEEWRRLIVAHKVSGAQVHDTRLVAAMKVHNVRKLLTYNTRDFARFPGIEVLHPADVAKTA